MGAAFREQIETELVFVEGRDFICVNKIEIDRMAGVLSAPIILLPTDELSVNAPSDTSLR